MNPMQKMEPINQELLEKSVIETAMPGYLIFLMSKSVITKGYQLRSDIVVRLNRGAAAAFSPLADDPKAVKRTAKRTDDIATKILYKLSPDDPVEGLYACAMFALVLVDENYLDDVMNMGVLVAQLLIDDIKEDGGADSFKLRSVFLKNKALEMLREAKQHGIYDLQLIAQKPLWRPPEKPLSI